MSQSNPPVVERLNAEVDESHSGQRLDRFLSDALPQLSRTRVQALIKQGQVASSGATIEDVKYRVKPGESYELIVPEVTETTLQAEDIPLNVVYEDDALIVIDKPAGLIVHPGAGQPSGTLVNALIAHCGKSLSGIGGVARPGIVHRLDKDTSGLIVVAKTDQAHRGLAKQFADHGRTGSLKRGYLAFVWGAPATRKGRIEGAIGRHPTSRTKMAVLRNKGRHAVTHWRLVETYGHDKDRPMASLLACTLETGRTHQVRVHMANIGHPLIGDPLYGRGFKSKLLKLPQDMQNTLGRLDRQALHAEKLAFTHPMSGTLLEFNSALPADLAEIAVSLKDL
jgi:23S rRNA pseudouridine1911/1915/1917 synthase